MWPPVKREQRMARVEAEINPEWESRFRGIADRVPGVPQYLDLSLRTVNR
jgi:hypothetical protein